MYDQIFSFLCYTLCDLIFFFSMHLFISSFAKVNISSGFIYIKYVLFFLFSEVLFYINSPTYIYIISSFSFIFFICLDYLKKLPRSLLFSGFFLLFGTICELIASLFLVVTLGSKLEHFQAEHLKLSTILATFLARLLLLLFTLILHSTFKSKDMFKHPTSFWIIAFLFPIGSLYIFYFLFFHPVVTDTTHYFNILLIFVTIFLMNIIVFSFYNRICMDFALRQENAALNHYIELQTMQQKVASEQNQRIAMINHDLKHYLMDISQLMQDMKYDDALARIHEKGQELVKNTMRFTSPSTTINNLLDVKVNEMERHNITANVSVILSDTPAISSGDLCVLLGNALDNATEYLLFSKLEQKFVNINIHYDYHTLTIRVQNPVEEEIRIPENLKIPTTKNKQKYDHGIGIPSMLKMTNKHNGVLQLYCQDNIFTLIATIIDEI